ncbi:MAG: acyl-CoA dehydratase activase-related protein [Bacillota bacterium]
MVSVGLPRALFHHEFGTLFETFFHHAGAAVEVSPHTTREILDLGVSSAVDETCLPVKIYYGHARWLSERVDAVFVPRVVSICPREYTCPKFLGLPDMIKRALRGRAICSPLVDVRRRGASLYDALVSAAFELGLDERTARGAMRSAVSRQRAMVAAMREAPKGKGPAVAVLGHRYLISDALSGMDVKQRLQALGLTVYDYHMVPESALFRIQQRVHRPAFWTYENKILAAAIWYMSQRKVDGIIQWVSFGCGPDSMVGEVVARECRQREVPHMLVTVDEHTGTAGVQTRLEAFSDMVFWRRGK